MSNPKVYAKKSVLDADNKLVDRYIGVDPAHPDVVYADRTSANGWEAIELKPTGKGFSAWFIDAKVCLSLDQFGNFHTRASAGGDETFFCTNQPDGSALLYRFQNDAALVEPVLTLEGIK